MGNLEELNLKPLSLDHLEGINGGKLSTTDERVIAFCLFGLFGLAVYELSRNQCNS